MKLARVICLFREKKVEIINQKESPLEKLDRSGMNKIEQLSKPFTLMYLRVFRIFNWCDKFVLSVGCLVLRC